MYKRLLGILAIAAMAAAPAQAGNQSGYSHFDESGVHVFRGQHGSPLTHAAIQVEQLRLQREAQAAHAAEIARLNAQIAAQTRQIDNLGQAVNHLERSQTRRPRRRVYYGNPAFFGSNGFIGNRYYGGATVQLPRRRPHHSRPRKP